MSMNTNGTGGDGTEWIWIGLIAVFFLGSGAATALAANAVTAVREGLVDVGLLVPAGQAAFPIGDTGVGVAMPVVLGVVAVVVALVVTAAYVGARRRARGDGR